MNRIANLAQTLGREVATPAEARKILGISSKIDTILHSYPNVTA
ncbi:hypothetical protein V7200_20560 [Cytobacillus firmus]|nr:hypothetical protein [Cytobacillus firmus]MED1907965.1 hypothetical protein [Cytobacillus firmus]